ncbi:MAG: hypothetical protein WC831_04440 [Parcubacteria group bacterium]|jgi:hypothetical protein
MKVKKKIAYLITHGERIPETANPGHTEEGLAQIRSLVLPADVSLIMAGTGQRFEDILKIISEKLKGVPVKYSPFCGGAESRGSNKTIILASGNVIPAESYVGLKAADIFDPWRLLEAVPDRTLFLAGGELLGALGFQSIKHKACLYGIDLAKRTAIILSKV